MGTWRYPSSTMKKKQRNKARHPRGANNKVHQVHDSYIRSLLADVEMAKSFVKAHLPANIVSRIDMNSFQLLNTNSVTKAMKKLQSDIVYSCAIDDKKGIYCTASNIKEPQINGYHSAY